MSQLTVAPSTQALMSLVEGPALLSKHVQIGKYIVDAMVIDAHPEVAQWYGYHSPGEIQGRYLSQLHDPHCFAQVRLYAVARGLGFPGVPTDYDIQIMLPTGTRRWLRKQQIRQITDGKDIYWISYCIPIADAQARPMPKITVPLSAAELESYLGRCSVAEAERLIEDLATVRKSLFNDTTINDTMVQSEISSDLVQLLGRTTSIELPLGNALYRRWVHVCNRCRRPWVAEKAGPKKCVHCKSPYWNVPRERRVDRGGRAV